MHTSLTGVHNLEQLVSDFDFDSTRLLAKHPHQYYDTDLMCNFYNSMDAYVCTSMQEGLSWTALESILCGTPVIASDSSAHPELINNNSGILVPSTEMSTIPIITTPERGNCFVETSSCSVQDIVKAMIKLGNGSDNCVERISNNCVEVGKKIRFIHTNYNSMHCPL